MDLSTTYMGMELKNPLVASASPLCASLDSIRRLEDAGAAAIVMFSIFEEQIKQEEEALDHFLSYGTNSFGEALSYFPEVDDYHTGPAAYLDLISRAVDSCDIPVIGSLNGISTKGWTDYAKRIEDAGASGLELNVFFIPTESDTTGAAVEQTYLDILQQVKSAVGIPVAMKLSPYFSAMANMAKQLDDAGADALVLFNRFYQPDFDLSALEVDRSLELSSAAEIRLPLLWTAVLSGKTKASIAATTGVQCATEMVKYLMAGADVVMSTSALLRHGPEYAGTLLDGLRTWMGEHAYDSVGQMKGSMSQQSVADPTAFERANYIKILETYKAEFGL